MLSQRQGSWQQLCCAGHRVSLPFVPPVTCERSLLPLTPDGTGRVRTWRWSLEGSELLEGALCSASSAVPRGGGCTGQLPGLPDLPG